ncbi:MAG: hypothetical protein L3J69_19385, partial [Desulfobacula sp.]|nr:hypothetical protein [Desulfobacula sp.]
SGRIFTKLQVDYLFSIFFFAILWFYFNQTPTISNLIPLSIPIAFLYLIKEIGFVLALLLLIIIFLDLLLKNDSAIRNRFKMIFVVVAMGFLVFFIKSIWQSHCETMGFSKFSGQINMSTISASLNIFANDQSRRGFFIFLKGLFLGEADRLNLPYFLWFGVIAFLWVKILKARKFCGKERIILLFRALFAAFLVYVVMNYFMQLIVFKIGESYQHTVGLERYLNILFTPVLLFFVAYYLDSNFSKKTISIRTVLGFCVVFFLVAGVSRVETTLRREEHFLKAEQIARQIESQIKDQIQDRPGSSINNTICIIPGNNDNELWIQLLYYLLPDNVNTGVFPMETEKTFFNALSKYDYVYFYSVDAKIEKWIQPYIDKPNIGNPKSDKPIDASAEAHSFFRIFLTNKIVEAQHYNLRLERLF